MIEQHNKKISFKLFDHEPASITTPGHLPTELQTETANLCTILDFFIYYQK